MSHRHIERQLSAYLDRELPPDEETAVRRHLDECARCREDLAQLTQVKAMLAGLPEHPLPEAFWPDLRRTLEREASPVARAARFWRIRPALALAVAAVVVLLLLVPFMRGQIGPLRAAEFGQELFVREHAVAAASDPLVDRAYLGLLVTDANLAIVGIRRQEESR